MVQIKLNHFFNKRKNKYYKNISCIFKNLWLSINIITKLLFIENKIKTTLIFYSLSILIIKKFLFQLLFCIYHFSIFSIAVIKEQKSYKKKLNGTIKKLYYLF